MQKLFCIVLIFAAIFESHGFGFGLHIDSTNRWRFANTQASSVEPVEKIPEAKEVENDTVEHPVVVDAELDSADEESDEKSNESNSPYQDLWGSILHAVDVLVPDDVEDAVGNAFNKVHTFIKDSVPDDVEDAVVEAGKAIGKAVQDIVPDHVEKAVGNAAGKLANELQKVKSPDVKESEDVSESAESSEEEEKLEIEPKKLNKKKLNKKKIITKVRNVQKKKMVHTKELKKSEKYFQ